MRWILILLALAFPAVFCRLLAGTTIGIFVLLELVILPILLASITLPFPLKDTGSVRYNSVPWMTITLILINSIVFFLWQGRYFFGAMFPDPENMEAAYTAFYGFADQIWTYGFRTSFIYEGASIGAWTAFTSMFMHGDHLHLIGNMIYLWAFGRRLEDGCGPWRFLLFYLFSGLIATVGSALLNPPSTFVMETGETLVLDIPGIGASGAIAGVMGGYLLLFPGARVTCLWIVAIVLRFLTWLPLRLFTNEGEWKWTIDIPAWIILIFFVVDNLIPSLVTIQAAQGGPGVNTIAHLTGFLGALAIFFFVRKDLLTRYFAGRRI